MTLMDKAFHEKLPLHVTPSSLVQVFLVTFGAHLVGYGITFFVYSRLEGPEEPTEVAALVYFLKRSSMIWFTLWFLLMAMADTRIFTGTTPWNSSNDASSDASTAPTVSQVADRVQQNTFESSFQALGAGLT